MDSQDVVELSREALWIMTLVGGPLLLAALGVGLFIGLIQALTQIQEQTIAFVPKLIAMLALFLLTLPWLLTRLVQYSNELISGIPGRF